MLTLTTSPKHSSLCSINSQLGQSYIRYLTSKQEDITEGDRELGMTTASFLVAVLGGLVLVNLIQAQEQSGFISIACGSPVGTYTETTTGINYTSDANLINTGVTWPVVTDVRRVFQRQLRYLRSFPGQEGIRNCYKINITRGSTYLIRVSFLYGNYDGLNKLPQFDVLLGANRWSTVNISSATVDEYHEIIYVPSLDYIHICLANTGFGTPFISAIELRTLENGSYDTEFGPMETYHRWDLGSDYVYSYVYGVDVYDRFWETYGDNNDWTNISTPADSLKQFNNSLKLPPIVMSTAVTPANASAPLIISWKPKDEKEEFYVYMHFMEVQVLANNQSQKREFNIMYNGNSWLDGSIIPQYLKASSVLSTSPFSAKEIIFSLEKTKNSTLPPIINAMEIYKIIEFKQSDTFEKDVDAITQIKSVYGLTKDWQGDPCGPVAYLWDGLNCTYAGTASPRITTLNLSSSGLSGKIDPSISDLIMLENLDLSNNSLNGEVPDFLSQLQQLKVLNLENNNLTGSIPSALLEKSKHGSLLLSMGQNPYLCQYDQCNKKKKKKNIITPLALTGGVLFLLVAVAAILWTLKKRKPKASVVEMQSQISVQNKEPEDALLQFKNQVYSYTDVLKITNNFSTVVGKGGFGTVYLGYIDDIPVAVKMLSTSSVHGYQQFQAEVQLLMRVHHRNLTSLVGYCNEGTNKALMYEYMANGNLQEHLSGKHKNTKFLSWENRLRIAVDAALGLEYLHYGCKPAIIHRDIKSTNILLNEHFQAKISDFGLSKIIPNDGATHVFTVIAGTPGYLDPDYSTTNRLTEKSDVYSFGVVLLEIITSQPVISRNLENSHITQWISSLVARRDIKAIAASKLEGDYDSNSVWKAVEIAMACVSPNPNKRPIISVVVAELKESLATELARNNCSTSGANTGDSPITMDLNTEFTPLAR